MILNAQLAQLNSELAQLREERDGWAVTKRRLESNVASLERDLSAAGALATTQHQLLVQALDAMQQAVHFRETGQGRPPEQTCLLEIEAITQHLKGKAHEHE